MGRNVEIKAAARDWQAQMARAAALASLREDLRQEDVFFHSARGRLKLRTVATGSGETASLISYNRADTPGPTASDYVLCPVADAAELCRLLAAALGRQATVRKHRSVFYCGQTRVHFDDVEGLGRFIELEVVLRPEQTVAGGAALARAWMERLLIREEDLVTGAYADALTGGGGIGANLGTNPTFTAAMPQAFPASEGGSAVPKLARMGGGGDASP